MTNREAYVFGWMFGRLSIEAEEKSKDIEAGILEPASRPYSSFGQIIIAAHTAKIMTKELDLQIGEAVCEIKNVTPVIVGGTEKVQSHDNRGQWYLGYYAGRGKYPLAQEVFDISAARKSRGMSQAQLAKAMGVNQPMISRWETGGVSPNKENLAKLKEILNAPQRQEEG